jgi:Ca2+-binding EF-hand superfamily protein
MGSTLSLAHTVQPDFSPLARKKVDHTNEIVDRFVAMKLPSQAIDIKAFTTLFSEYGADKATYSLFDGNGVGKIDFFEVVAAMLVSAHASAGKKAQAAFQLYDFDASGNLNYAEMVLLLRCVCNGVSKMTGTDLIPLEEIKGLCDDAVNRIDSVKDGNITYIEIASWVREDKGVAALLQKSWEDFDPSKPPKKAKPVEPKVPVVSKSTRSPRSKAANAASRDKGNSSSNTGSSRSGTIRGNSSRGGGGGSSSSSNSKARSPGKQGMKREKKIPFSKAEVMILRTIFNEIDKDMGGAVSSTEFLAHAEASDHGAQFSGDMFISMDRDGDGEMTFKELINGVYPHATRSEVQTMAEWKLQADRVERANAPEAIAARKKLAKGLSMEDKEQVKELFYLYDLDGDGVLTFDEIKGLLHSVAGVTGGEYSDVDRETRKLFDQMDTVKDGTLSLDEFMQMMEDASKVDISKGW